MPGDPNQRVRVEAAAYRDRPVSFHIVWPWTRPARMDTASLTAGQRAAAFGGAIFLLVLLGGAVALARYNLKSGRADSRGAARVSLVLLGIWCAAWALGARHSFSLDAELNAFMRFIALALLNIGFTWLFYLGLEPFVRKYRPEILISWTRVLGGQLTDPRVGRDVLIGIAVGILVSQAAPLFAITVGSLQGGVPTPRASNLDYMLGARLVLSTLLRALPNALQSAMIGTFAYVLLLALFGRRQWLTLAGAVTLFVLIVLAESGGEELLWTFFFAAIVAVPVMFVFVRFGLLAIAVVMMTLQAINSVPLTADVTKAHALASAMTLILLLAIAAGAFHVSRAGQGLLRKVLPAI